MAASKPHSRELDIARRVLAQHPESEATEALLARAVLGLFEQLEAFQPVITAARKLKAADAAWVYYDKHRYETYQEAAQGVVEAIQRFDDASNPARSHDA